MINIFRKKINKLPPNSTKRCLGVNFNESIRRRNERSLINSGIQTIVYYHERRNNQLRTRTFFSHFLSSSY